MLKPCPFCGCNEIYYDDDGYIEPNAGWAVFCMACECGTNFYNSKEEVLERWNTRVD